MWESPTDGTGVPSIEIRPLFSLHRNGAFTGTRGRKWGLCVGLTSVLTHRISAHLNAVCVVDQPVEDSQASNPAASHRMSKLRKETRSRGGILQRATAGVTLNIPANAPLRTRLRRLRSRHTVKQPTRPKPKVRLRRSAGLRICRSPIRRSASAIPKARPPAPPRKAIRRSPEIRQWIETGCRSTKPTYEFEATKGEWKGVKILAYLFSSRTTSASESNLLRVSRPNR
jgi:hypothetical protein